LSDVTEFLCSVVTFEDFLLFNSTKSSYDSILLLHEPTIGIYKIKIVFSFTLEPYLIYKFEIIASLRQIGRPRPIPSQFLSSWSECISSNIWFILSKGMPLPLSSISILNYFNLGLYSEPIVVNFMFLKVDLNSVSSSYSCVNLTSTLPFCVCFKALDIKLPMILFNNVL